MALRQNLGTLRHTLQLLATVLTFGESSVAKRLQRAHGHGQRRESERVCDLLLAGAGVAVDSEEGRRFRETMPAPMPVPVDIETFEQHVEQAFHDVTSSTGAKARADAGAGTDGIMSTLASIFPDGSKSGVGGRWALRNLLEYVMLLRYPSLKFTLGPALFAFCNLRGTPHKVLHVLHIS